MANQQVTPREFLTTFIKNINIKYKIVFFSCFIFSLFAQSMGLFNKISFNDDIFALFDVGATYTSGRWGLEILKKFIIFIFGDGHYSLPVFNGFVSIIFLSLTACIIINLLNIKNQINYIFISGILVCFPVITYLFGYMFTLPYYMMSVMFGTLGTYFICKKTKFCILGILLISLSIGIYQAFLPFTLSLFVLYLISFIANNHKKNNKDIIKKILLIFISVLSSVILYFTIAKLYLVYYNAQLTTYREINTLGLTSVSGYLNRIVFAYTEFFNPTTSAEYYMYPTNTIYIYYFSIFISIILAILLIMKTFKRNKFNALLLSITFALLPLTVNFIFVMSPSEIVHSLMMYSQLIPFILFAWLTDNTAIKNKKFNISFKSTVYTILILLNIMYCRYDNKCFLKATLSQQQLISYYTTLITQIKSIDGYSDNYPIMFINEYKIKDRTIQNIKELQLIKAYPYKNTTTLINNHAWKEFMKYWLGYSPIISKNKKIKYSAEVRDMPSYPSQGAIKKINNVIVVKF